MSVSAHPLDWPAGWERTLPDRRQRARFGKRSNGYGLREITVADAVGRVRSELAAMGVSDDELVISTSLTLRLDGLPRSGQAAPEDPGAAVYWRAEKSSAQRCMAIDLYHRVEDNLGAIAATLSAMRAIERHGGAEILDRAFTGFIALPPPIQAWAEMLEVPPDADSATVRAAYQRLRARHHPDRAGGNPGKFQSVMHAWGDYLQSRSST